MTSTEFGPVRPLDAQGLAATPAGERFVQRLLNRESGASDCSVTLIRTPAGGGSPEGLHRHDFEQVFHLIEGTMKIEVEGEVSEVHAGSIVVFPKGVAHRNWNAGSEPTLHLAIAAPAPPVGETGTYPVRPA
ncbi:cupin domain-containing protein [Amycolatopsis rhabdoformis]|uniref:Cupin domain-containing protein n=1 Tax=Amycolatopsis rhabdoformis TaxID=1448059 RepID=A0ABZ1IEE4_9PSEU|nr:cupin domain-containing protein [Amycolatopsis rhabdoformis]WSE31909.1 cupin domain-containing protein [Amycolatopsis rhabdoformis]